MSSIEHFLITGRFCYDPCSTSSFASKLHHLPMKSGPAILIWRVRKTSITSFTAVLPIIHKRRNKRRRVPFVLDGHFIIRAKILRDLREGYFLGWWCSGVSLVFWASKKWLRHKIRAENSLGHEQSSLSESVKREIHYTKKLPLHGIIKKWIYAQDIAWISLWIFSLSSAYVAAFIADKILQHAGHKYFRICIRGNTTTQK